MEKLIKKIWVIILLFFILGIGGVCLVVGMIVHFSQDLPDYRQLESYDPPGITRLYSMDGKLMEEYALEKRIYVDYQSIPTIVIQAFVAAEDKNFFQHQGVDLYSIIRAAIQNILKLHNNGSPVGGSTITQQVVKNFLLTNERTISRKIKEAILAYRITNVYSKERILELYLNQIFLGNNSYGIAAASLNYFNKELRDLTIEEAAMLAALPKAPSQINPVRYYNRAKERRDWVISRMLEEGFLSQQEASKAIESVIKLNKRREEFVRNAEYYSDTIRSELIKILDEDSVYTKGYSVFTHMNTKYQEWATKALRTGIENYDKKRGFRGPIGRIENVGKGNWPELMEKFIIPLEAENHPIGVIVSKQQKSVEVGVLHGKLEKIQLDNIEWAGKKLSALSVGDVIAVKREKDHYMLDQIPQVNGGIVVLEVGTGKVLALVGGYNFSSKFNRVTQAERQPGSVFKPIVYLTAFESGYKPNDTIVDEPISISQGPGLPLWRPKNYGSDFLGEITLRKALEKSRNIPTVKLAVSLGLDKIAATANRLGIYSAAPGSLAVALGAYETTLLKMSNAFNIIASYGKAVRPVLIDRIVDRHGNILYTTEEASCEDCDDWDDTDKISMISKYTSRVVPEDVSYQMISVLEGVVKRGTGAKALQLKKTVAGKTGTTNQSFDSWFVGFTPEIVVGVYVGYDTPRSLGARETGATLALPIFVDFMKDALSGRPDIPFQVPKSVKLVRVNADGSAEEDEEVRGAKSSILEVFKASDSAVSKSLSLNGDEKLDGIEEYEDSDGSMGVEMEGGIY